MRPFLILLAAIFALPAWSCSCGNTRTPCSELGTESVIFVGHARQSTSERIFDGGPTRVVVEEALQNVPPGLREVDIQTGVNTSCAYPLRAGEKHVFITFAPHFAIGGCSNTFPLEGNQHVLDALRQQIRTGAPRIIGRVSKRNSRYGSDKPLANVSVVARSAEGRYTAVTNGQGAFVLGGLTPGQYELFIAKQGFVPHVETDVERQVRSRYQRVQPNTLASLYAVTVGERGCFIKDLSMWPAGTIQGTVRGLDQKPIAGVTVQAFGFDRRKERESQPFLQAKTNSDGTYTLQPLPEGDLVVAVNGETYRDNSPYPPTFFNQSDPITLTESGAISGIDLTLPAARIPAQLLVKFVDPSGQPFAVTSVKLENKEGVQRYYGVNKPDADGLTRIPVYIGEQYTIKASKWAPGDQSQSRGITYEGQASVRVTGQDPVLTIIVKQQEPNKDGRP